MKYGTFIQVDECSYLDIQYVVGFELHKIDDSYRWVFLMSTEKQMNAKSFPFKTEREAKKWLDKTMKGGG